MVTLHAYPAGLRGRNSVWRNVSWDLLCEPHFSSMLNIGSASLEKQQVGPLF